MSWEVTVRTGDPAADRHSVELYRQQAAAQGLALLEQPLPGGGIHVRALPPQGAYPQYPQQPYGHPQYAPQQYAPQQHNPYAPPAAQPVAPMVRQAAHVAHGCQVCGRDAPTKHVTLLQNIGFLVARMHKQTTGNLCKSCIKSVGWRYTLVTFFFGWWGVISFFFTLFILPANLFTMLSARSLPEK